MKIGIVGSGPVAQTLAKGFVDHGHDVLVGSREPSKLESWAKANPGAKTGTFEDAARFGDVIVLAVKGTAASEALRLAGAANLAGKTVVDTTNPIADAPPDDGVLRFFTSMTDSLMERLQREFPAAKLVKAFNSVGGAYMVHPTFAERPTMFVCGNDPGAKKQVETICDQFGWETADMGTAAAARAIEPLCMLWCIPGIARGDWSPRAFKLLK